MRFDNVIARHYSHEIQMSLGQVHAIVSAIAMAGPGCKLLVFGCGNDSELWFNANPGGKTVFLEDDSGWMERTTQKFPHLDIRLVDYGSRTVADSLPIREKDLATFEVPGAMREEAWDVIVIDGPRGYSNDTPGRSLPIYWASLVARGSTQVFVGDYERELERKYADRFLNASRTWHSVIPRIVTNGRKSDGSMLWSMGTGERRASSSVPARRERGAVIFLLDSAYLPGFHTLVYSLKNALAERTHDIVVISSDQRVREDRVVFHLADKVIIVSDDDIRIIKKINSSKVNGHSFHENFGKFTFLKLLMFKNLGYAHHIFLDSDMICLDPNFSFNDLVGTYDFAAAPTMGSVFLELDGISPQGWPRHEKIFMKISRLMNRTPSAQRNFNSGVIFVGRSIIGEYAFNRLVHIGSSESFGYEQAILHRFITTCPGIKFKSLPIGYNFTYFAAKEIGEVLFRSMRAKLKFLHFNIPHKPWMSGEEHNWIDRIWLDLSKEAVLWHGTLGGSDPVVRRHHLHLPGSKIGRT